MRRSVDADKLMDGLGRLATDTDLCKRYGNCTPWIPYSAVRKLISDMILEEKESCDDAVSRKAMLEKIRLMQTYKLFSGDDMLLIDQTEAQTELMMLPSVQPEQRWIPVSERLPEEEYVLISKKPTKISGSKWSVAIAIRTADPRSRKIQWRDSGFGVIQDDKVLAWMPLPEPWKGEEDEAD